MTTKQSGFVFAGGLAALAGGLVAAMAMASPDMGRLVMIFGGVAMGLAIGRRGKTDA